MRRRDRVAVHAMPPFLPPFPPSFSISSIPAACAAVLRRCERGLASRQLYGAPRTSASLTASIIKGLALMVSIIATSGFAQGAFAAPADGVYDLLVGTYTGPKSEGIYVYRFDTKTGAATQLSAAQTVTPAYLAASRDGRYVYAVDELPGDNGPATQRGGISAFGFDARSG